MALLQQSDLKFKYSWSAIPPDDPKATGKPDSVLLNRDEGYEVLPFINRFAGDNGWKLKESGLKAERLIKKNLPGETRSHAHVKKWLIDNWEKYD